MGRTLLIARLVIGSIKRRPVEAALLLVMIATTTTTLTVALALRRVSESPYDRTRDATHGPDLVVGSTSLAGGSAAAAHEFAPFVHARGVIGSSGPYPLAFVHLTAPGVDAPVQAEGRDTAPGSIDRPLVISGRWIGPGRAVVEQGLAGALGLQAGAEVRLGGRPFTVSGIAITAAQPVYPARTPGLVWVTRADAARLHSVRGPLGALLNLRFTHPAAARQVLDAIQASALWNDPGSFADAWQDVRSHDYKIITVDQKVLEVASTLLALLAVSSIAVLVGGRMTEQTRRVGLLKAVGATPLLLAGALLAENLLLGIAAGAVGLLAGGLIAPLLTNPGSGLLGSSAPAGLTVTTVLEVLALAVAVAGAATVVPAIRGARTSTISALSDPAHLPRRRPRLIALSARLPVPLLFGLRLAARRPRRTILTAASLTIAVAFIVAALTLRYKLAQRDQRAAAFNITNAGVGDRVIHIVFMLSAVLIVLAAINAVFTAWATVLDAQRPTALARALGATPRQVGAGLTAAQLVPALVAGLLGAPLGLVLYQLAGGDLSRTSPPIVWLVAATPCTLVVVAALTAIPARLGAHRSIAPVLRVE